MKLIYSRQAFVIQNNFVNCRTRAMTQSTLGSFSRLLVGDIFPEPFIFEKDFLNVEENF